ncbi:MAG: UbiA family prenyltransferase [Rubripirellula sp.]
MFGSFAFWVGATYVCFPLGLLAYGWNDLGDTLTDANNPRKDSWVFGALPDQELRSRLPWIIAAVQIPFAILFVWIAGPKMLIWFTGLILANACYNSFGFKRLPILDLLNQAGYVLVFVLASWLCEVPQLNTPAIIFGAIFAMQSHLFGQLMDFDEDKAAGRKSTAITMGYGPAKVLLIAIMLCLASIAYMNFRSSLVALFMVTGAMFFAGDLCFGPRRYSVWFVTTFFLVWNVVVICSMHFVWKYGVFLVE